MDFQGNDLFKLLKSFSMFYSCEVNFYFPFLGVISTFIQIIVLSQFFFLFCQCCNYFNIYYLLLKFNREILLVDFKTHFISAAWKTDWKPRHEGCQRWIPSHPLVKANPINVNRLIILKVVLVFL